MRSMRDYHLLNYLKTITVPIVKIDLDSNKKGDRFKTKDGEIVTFCGKWYEFEEMRGEFYVFHLGTMSIPSSVVMGSITATNPPTET